MTVGTLLRTMSSSELTNWIGFAQLEPFGGDVDDYRAGIGAATAINLKRKEGAAVVIPSQLMPWNDYEPEKERVMSPEETSAAILNVLAASGAKRV